MNLWSAPTVDTRRHFAQERADLLASLADLSESQWRGATSAGTWLVKDVALHLLDGDLTRLSVGRDGDPTGLVSIASGERRFAELLAAKNERWVLATRHLSARVTSDLLAASTAQMIAWTEAADLHAPARVSWASDQPVPQWLDLAREFTETWVHHQQIRHAVAYPTDPARLPTVLRTFVWALPHQYRVAATAGTRVTVDLGCGDAWDLTSDGDGRWTLTRPSGQTASASVSFTSEAAWRSFVGQRLPDNEVTQTGPLALTEPVLRVRAIIT